MVAYAHNSCGNGAGLLDLIMHKIIARHKNDTLVYWLKVLRIMSSPALLKQTFVNQLLNIKKTKNASIPFVAPQFQYLASLGVYMTTRVFIFSILPVGLQTNIGQALQSTSTK